jgi:hypothetical protein
MEQENGMSLMMQTKRSAKIVITPLLSNQIKSRKIALSKKIRLFFASYNEKGIST